MRIDEFTDATIAPKFDYDVVDDVTVFMRNDPMFYRKSLFPAVSKIGIVFPSVSNCGKNVKSVPSIFP